MTRIKNALWRGMAVPVMMLQFPIVAFSAMMVAGHVTYSDTGDNWGDMSKNVSLGLLGQEQYLSYAPFAPVADKAAIDLDQHAMEKFLATATLEDRMNAFLLYVEGYYSGSYAELTLDKPIQIDTLDPGLLVVGQTADGNQVNGTTAGKVKFGETVIQIPYDAILYSEVSNWTGCRVGGTGNPESVTDGCLAPTGMIDVIGFGSATYTYNPLESTFNLYTLQGFSVQAQESYYECSRCPYDTYAKFYDYYGEFDYANQWIISAFSGGITNFAKGNADFSGYGSEGTNEAIQKGTVYMSLWMHVIGRLEDAVADCGTSCKGKECSDGGIHHWDAAVAFYVGSTPAHTDGPEGYLLFTEAQKSCQSFGTCVDNGLAQVNVELFEEFKEGKRNWLEGGCSPLRDNVERITELMTVPLVQGTLEYAHRLDKQEDSSEQTEAAGAVMAASVLPLVHACNQEDSDVIYNNMRLGNGGSVDYEAVKTALERNYDCLGITCLDVGGRLDSVSGGYMVGAEPCVLSV